jgi:hypothetical protein
MAPTFDQDFSSYGNLSNFFNNDFSQWGGPVGTNRGDVGDQLVPNTQPAQDWMGQNNFTLKGMLDGQNMQAGIFKNGQDSPFATAYGGSLNDNNFGLASSLLGGAFAGFVPIGAMAGGGLAGNIAQGAASGMTSAGVGGGDPLKGALTGGLGGGLGSFNPAGYANITEPSLAGGFNRAIGSGLGAAATGGNVGQAALSGGISGAVGGMFKPGGAMSGMSDIFKQFMSPGEDTSLSNNVGQNASYPSEGTSGQQLYNNMTDNGGMSFAPGSSPSANSFSGMQDYSGGGQSSPQEGMKQAQSFSMPSMPQGTGSFLSSHGGDLASMLYSMYNNRKQQNQLGDQMNSLQGMFGQNSAYAQNMRNTLMAKAAQGGHRSDIGGREVQLQAALAQHAAGLMPAMMQMQNSQQGLQNNNMNIMRQGFNKLGGMQGLQSLFSPQSSLSGQGSLPAYQRMDDGYSNMGGG